MTSARSRAADFPSWTTSRIRAATVGSEGILSMRSMTSSILRLLVNVVFTTSIFTAICHSLKQRDRLRRLGSSKPIEATEPFEKSASENETLRKTGEKDPDGRRILLTATCLYTIWKSCDTHTGL